MTQLWKIVLTIIAVLLVLGVLLAGTGLITGASPNRIVELLYGGVDGLLGALDGLRQQALQLLAQLRSISGVNVASFIFQW